MKLYELKSNPYFFPLFYIVFGTLMVFIVFFTQIPSIMQMFFEIEQKESKVDQLQNSIQLISAYPSEQLESDIEIANKALPPEKDISLVSNALSRLARELDVALESYSVSVGDVYDIDRSKNIEKTTGITEVMQVDVVVSVDSTQDISKFLENLYLRLPLSSIDSVRIIDGNGRIALSFYYFEDQNISRVESNIVTPLDENRRRVLDTIRNYSQN